MSLIRSHSDERLAEQGMLTLTDEKLERAFREIEEASERRAQEEAKDDTSTKDEDGHPAPLPGAPTADGVNESTPTAGTAVKKRHRGSISISRVGTYPDLSNAVDGSASPVPWIAPVVLPAPPAPVATNTLYKVQKAAASVSTLATTSTVSSFSRSHGGTSHYHDEELNHTTQKQTIIGRRNTLTRVGAHFAGAVQAVSNLAEAVSEKVGGIGKTGSNGVIGAVEVRRGRPRAMTRSRSKQALRAAVEHDALVSREDPVVIGVQVQAKTTEEKRASAENADDEGADGSGACSSRPIIATVIHASKSESEIRQSTDASSSIGKKGRPRTATGSGDALPPPPQSFATVSAGMSAKILASTSTSAAGMSGGVEGASGSGASSEKQERRKSQTLGPASGGGAKFRNTASKRLSILRTGLASPSPSASASGTPPQPLSPSASASPLRSPSPRRRSPLPSPSRNPSFPSLAPSLSTSSFSAAPAPPVPHVREQTTTIEVGRSPAFTLGGGGAAGLDAVASAGGAGDQGKDGRTSRPALKRSFTHYARVLAKKLKRRTVSAGPDVASGSNSSNGANGTNGGNGTHSVSSSVPGIMGVTTSTTVVEEVKPSGSGEPSRYPLEDDGEGEGQGQEIEIRVEDEDGLQEQEQGLLQKALAAPLPPSPSPVGAQSFGDAGANAGAGVVVGVGADDGTRGDSEVEEPGESGESNLKEDVADSAIEVVSEPERGELPVDTSSAAAEQVEGNMTSTGSGVDGGVGAPATPASAPKDSDAKADSSPAPACAPRCECDCACENGEKQRRIGADVSSKNERSASDLGSGLAREDGQAIDDSKTASTATAAAADEKTADPESSLSTVSVSLVAPTS